MDEQDRRFLEWASGFPEAVAVLAELERDASFSSDDKEEAARLLAACALGFVQGTENEPNPGTVKSFLSGLSNGYGCWLSAVEEAISSATFENEAARSYMLGAFYMAKQFLFDIERQDRPR